MTIDRSIEEPCEVTSLTHGFEAERRGRPLRLGSGLNILCLPDEHAVELVEKQMQGNGSGVKMKIC